MDSNRLKEAYQRLELLDDRLTYKIRPRSGGFSSPSPDHIDAKLKELAEYTLELKDILREFMLAFARRKSKASEPPGGTPV
ncbi:MAG: hypothetical protein V3T72_02140 [Thermoanaerobaculia bacterium]